MLPPSQLHLARSSPIASLPHPNPGGGDQSVSYVTQGIRRPVGEEVASMSLYVQVFGCRHDEAIHALRRPASEKRQGTKSREVGHRWCRGRLWRFSRGTLI